MSVGSEQRKLAAIMFTDMVGYSALSQRDDKLALELDLFRIVLPWQQRAAVAASPVSKKPAPMTKIAIAALILFALLAATGFWYLKRDHPKCRRQ